MATLCLGRFMGRHYALVGRVSCSTDGLWNTLASSCSDWCDFILVANHSDVESYQ